MKTGQASTTAKVIAASTLLLASDIRTAKLVAPGAAAMCKQFLSGSWSDRWLAKSASFPLTKWVWHILERLTLPGIMVHYWYRKRWIEQRCRTAIANGCERVIILGAGFDTLGCRLSQEFGSVEIIEIDHPATQTVKQRALAVVTSNNIKVKFIALDLGKQALPESLLNDRRKTLVIAEGLLMYLSAENISRLFETLHRLSSQHVHVIFSYLVRWPDGKSGFRPCSWLIERWLDWRGEPFTWAIELDAISHLLTHHHFILIEMAEAQNYKESDAILLEGENLVMCKTKSKYFSTSPSVEGLL